MYEDITPEIIKERVLAKVADKLNTAEGSFANEIISPLCSEIWGMYQGLNAVIPIAFPDETSGEYIDKKCGYYGIERKKGTRAFVALTFRGKDGTVIPKGTTIITDGGLEFITEEAKEIAKECAEVRAHSSEAGSRYNVEKDTITRQFRSISGVTSVTNILEAEGGTDDETDKALLTRLYAHLQKPSTSGNVNDYYKWALEADGVGEAKIIPLWNGNGTVKIVVASQELLPVDSTVTNGCKSHVDGLRPIGAEVTVISAQGVDIAVTSNVILENNRTLADISKEYRQKIAEYVKSIAFKGQPVSINYLGYLLLGIKGVAEYSNLKINGALASVELTAEQVPVLGEVVLSEIN